MKTIIFKKENLQCVGVTQNNTSVEWEIEHNVIPNFGGEPEDYDFIETNLQRFHLERNKQGEVVVIEDSLSAVEQRQQILQQLAELDKIVPRILEDIVAQGNYTIHQSKLDVITQKESLRQQLQQLQELN